MIKYLNGTNKKYRTLSADGLKVITWYMGASFLVQPDFKSHTVEIMTMTQVVIHSVSRKHNFNTRSSTEAQLFAVDDASV